MATSRCTTKITIQERNALATIPYNKRLYRKPSKSYKFIIDRTGLRSFRCPLKSARCVYSITPAKRCSRRTVAPFGLCWQHALYRANLKIGHTTLTDAGGRRFSFRGLFACNMNHNKETRKCAVFRKGDRITAYLGDKMSPGRLDRRYPGNMIAPYAFLNGGKVVDGACARGIATFANACRAANKPSCTSNNAKIRGGTANHYPYLEATRHIYHDDEIFASYGAVYFRGKMEDMETVPQRKYNRINYKCPR